MRRKPKIFIWIATLYALLAISLPVQIVVIYDHGLNELDAIFNKLTVFNWLVMIGLFGCSYLIARVSPWARYAVPAVIGIVATNNFFVGYVGTDYSMWAATLATLGFVLISVPLAQHEIRSLFLSPNRRWWRVAERKEVHVPVILNDGLEWAYGGETFDMSESGIFIEMPAEFKGVGLNQSIPLQLKLNSGKVLRCTGRIVRQAKATGKYPAGMGVQFVSLTRQQRTDLRKYLDGIH